MAINETTQPSITFVLFAYNQAQYIREAVAGALAQTYSPIEIILSDDCSEDDTFEIMQSLAATYRGPHRIILNRNQKNLGIGLHVNKAFALATGDWVVTGAGDDISDPSRCQKIAELAATYPNAAAIGLGWRDIDENGDLLPSQLLPRYAAYRIDSLDDPSTLSHFEHGDFGLWGMSAGWKRSLIETSPLLTLEAFQEDEILSFWALVTGASLIHHSEAFVSYRHHEDNVCGYQQLVTQQVEEQRRTRRARIAFATWSFLHHHLLDAEIRKELSLSAPILSRLTTALKLKIRRAERDATWWDMGTARRFFHLLTSPGRSRLLKRPLLCLRLLPLPIYLKLMASQRGRL